MSQRVQLSTTPTSQPSLFREVPHNEVQRGDLYQGSRDASKWYQNTEGQGCVDFWRTYYRPVNSGSVTVSSMSGRRMSHVNTPPGARTASSPAGSTAGTTAAAPAGQSAEHEEDDADAVVIKSVERSANGTLKVTAEITLTEDTFARFVADSIRDVLNSERD